MPKTVATTTGKLGKGACPCQYLDCGLLNFTTVRKKEISLNFQSHRQDSDSSFMTFDFTCSWISLDVVFFFFRKSTIIYILKIAQRLKIVNTYEEAN